MKTSTICALLGALSLTTALPAVAQEAPAGPGAATTSGGPPVMPPYRPRSTGPHGQHDPHGGLGAESLVRVALQHQQEGRPGEAMRTLDQAVERYPRDARVRAVRASLLLADGRVARALEDLEMAVKLGPDDPQVLVNRAEAYRRFGRIGEALADLDRAVALDGDLVAARFNRGAIRYANGDYAGALEDLDRCIAVDPHAPGPYFNRAATYRAMGRREQAVADLRRFMEVAGNPEWKKTAQRLLEEWQKPVAGSGTPAPAAPGEDHS